MRQSRPRLVRETGKPLVSQTQWVGNAGDGGAGQPDGGQEDHPEASNEGELLILLGLGEKWVLPEPGEREIWLELKNKRNTRKTL